VLLYYNTDTMQQRNTAYCNATTLPCDYTAVLPQCSNCHMFHWHWNNLVLENLSLSFSSTPSTVTLAQITTSQEEDVSQQYSF